MPRILLDLSDDDIRWLDAKAAEQGVSRAAVLREAVSSYRSAAGQAGIERYFGIWRTRDARSGGKQSGKSRGKGHKL